jgi:hypothetical protein
MTTNYFITYDLHNRRDYVGLYQLLAGWKAVRLTQSDWLVRLNGAANVVRDLVLRHLDADDTVAVIEIPKDADWATMRVSAAANTFLSSNVAPSQKAA